MPPFRIFTDAELAALAAYLAEPEVRRDRARTPRQRASLAYPNSLPRPAGELETLEGGWALPQGWRIVTAVNNTVIGYFYIGTAFLFFLLAGVLALLMRAQLAVPSNTFLSQETYNQIFTMHGTVMMFLFAVPAVEAMGVLLLPQMLGARDLPFPRLGAFAFWAYFVGGLVFFSTLFFDLAPSGGWFMYPPLTSAQLFARTSAPISGCSASASSRSRRSPARSRSSSACCARARPACRSTRCRCSPGRC